MDTNKISTAQDLSARFVGSRRVWLKTDKVRQCYAAAKAWERRATAYARVGQFREADDCDAETASIYRLMEYVESGAV